LNYKGIKKDSKWAVYSNKGYSQEAFRDKHGDFNYGSFTDSGDTSGDNPVVASFLRHLLFGAHFVFVSTKTDVGSSQPQNLYNTFKNSGLTKNSDSTNSHYVNSWSPTTPMMVNTSGWYYQVVTGDTTPDNNGLILALLFGQTSDASDTNTFMQLEGWQNVSNNTRHGADYAAYKEILWNYSTFAACVWSERRCCPIFVAPSSFGLKLQSDTHMPHYVGAGSKQNWMATDLLQIPKSS
jgi:hypothetical protein